MDLLLGQLGNLARMYGRSDKFVKIVRDILQGLEKNHITLPTLITPLTLYGEDQQYADISLEWQNRHAKDEDAWVIFLEIRTEPRLMWTISNDPEKCNNWDWAVENATSEDLVAAFANEIKNNRPDCKFIVSAEFVE